MPGSNWSTFSTSVLPNSAGRSFNLGHWHVDGAHTRTFGDFLLPAAHHFHPRQLDGGSLQPEVVAEAAARRLGQPHPLVAQRRHQ